MPHTVGKVWATSLLWRERGGFDRVNPTRWDVNKWNNAIQNKPTSHKLPLAGWQGIDFI